KEIVVKMGSQGALWVTDEGSEFTPSFKVEAVDTTAAGDAFTGALTVALAGGMERRAAIRQGMLAGALAVTKFGAQPSLPSREELERFAAGQGV
ncbi:MAG: ribokinase, partial [Planctomycetes bacterium]|nr:ribokinase [Planctomycetota bacterium]